MMIELQSVTKLYGRVIGVNDITLSLPTGAYGLLGPNGAGKSTLLNLLIGQLRPTIGTVSVLGVNPRNNAELQQQLGFCPGSDGLYAGVSGYEWVTYLLQLHGWQAARARERAEFVLDQVGMADAMRRPIGSYSRGMRQRTKLAQAIAHEPQILILDEPFNGLDPIGRHDMTVLMREWIADGKGLIIASHVLHEIESITASFLLICGGRLLASGSSDDVHAMLIDIPSEITIKTSQPRRMAEILLEHDAGHALELTSDRVTIATLHTGRLFQEMPGWLAETGIQVDEMHSPDESMQSLFNSLMKIHRGEIS